MKSIGGIIVLGLLLAASVAAGMASDIAFCQFEVPRYVKEGNFNFYVIYTFSLDEEGRPSAITKLKNDYVRDEEVKSCLRDWRLEGFSEGAMISVSFHWTHAVGWDRLAISGPGFEQRILLTGERAPYRPVEDSAKRPIGAGHDEVTKLASGGKRPGTPQRAPTAVVPSVLPIVGGPECRLPNPLRSDDTTYTIDVGM